MINLVSESDIFGKNPFKNSSKVAFLGISNWSIVASKINEPFNVIQEPNINDLKKTSLEMPFSKTNKYLINI